MDNNQVVLTGVVQSEVDQMPGGVMLNVRLNPVGENHSPHILWGVTINVSDEVATHPLLTRGKKLRITISEG